MKWDFLYRDSYIFNHLITGQNYTSGARFQRQYIDAVRDCITHRSLSHPELIIEKARR